MNGLVDICIYILAKDILSYSDNRVKDPFCKRNICDGDC
jgi:hypothetical protein